MRMALLLNINGRLYPARFDTAKDLQRVIDEVVPNNGTTLRLGRRPDGNMGMVITQYDPTKIQTLGLVKYTPTLYTDKTVPRWLPLMLDSSQKIVDGVIVNGYFDLDGTVPTKIPFDETYQPQLWVAKVNQYTVTPTVNDFVYLADDPMVRAWGFRFKTPKGNFYNAAGELVDNARFWFNRTVPAGHMIFDENFQQVLPETTSYYRLKIDKVYYYIIKSTSIAIDESALPAAHVMLPTLYPATGETYDLFLEDFSNKPNGYQYEFNSSYIQYQSLASHAIANRYTFLFTAEKDELVRFVGQGIYNAEPGEFIDVTTGKTPETYISQNQTFYRIFAGRQYILAMTRYYYSDDPRTTWLMGITKYTTPIRPYLTDQDLDRNIPTWYDYSTNTGNYQRFPSLTESQRAANFKGLIISMHIEGGIKYGIYTNPQYPYYVAVYKKEDVNTYLETGVFPTPLKSISVGGYNRWSTLNWEVDPAIPTGEYVVEISTASTSESFVQMRIAPVNAAGTGITSATITTTNAPYNATNIDFAKMVSIPMRINYIKTGEG